MQHVHEEAAIVAFPFLRFLSKRLRRISPLSWSLRAALLMLDASDENASISSGSTGVRPSRRARSSSFRSCAPNPLLTADLQM